MNKNQEHLFFTQAIITGKGLAHVCLARSFKCMTTLSTGRTLLRRSQWSRCAL